MQTWVPQAAIARSRRRSGSSGLEDRARRFRDDGRGLAQRANADRHPSAPFLVPVLGLVLLVDLHLVALRREVRQAGP